MTMTITKSHFIFLIVTAFALTFTACDLTKNVEIELPDYQNQPVVECYLEPGKPFRLLLTNSYDFFDPLGLDSNFINETMLQGATVAIRYNGQTIQLNNQFSFELNPLKLFNYTATQIVPAEPGIVYTLDITLPDGGKIEGSTIMLPRVEIDSVPVEFGPTPGDTLARTLMYITDNPNTEDFYRRMLHYASMDSVARQDFITDDRLAQTSKVAFGMGYDLAAGDTVFNTIFHITPEHYDFVESVSLSVAGSLNPFAQPSRIISNVSGSGNPMGIFTCLVYDRDTTIIRR